jgi:hypothetical protein
MPERQIVHRASSRWKAMLPRKSDQVVHLRSCGQHPIQVWTSCASGLALSNAVRLKHNDHHHHYEPEAEEAAALNRRF